MKTGIAACFVLTVLLTTVCAGTHPHPPKQQPPTDPEYVFALAAATNFLHAWQTGDLENGTVLLSNSIRHSENANQLEEFFSTGTDRSFEIAKGAGHPGRYSFPVVLVTLRGSHVARKSSEVVMAETGKNDWVVDKLP